MPKREAIAIPGRSHSTSRAKRPRKNGTVRQTRPMSEWPDVEAVVIPPSASGVVLLTGAAELVTDAILDLELDLDYVQREVTQDAAGITCVRVDPAGESLEEVQHRIENALVTLARRDDVSTLTAGYGLVVADECHHVPAAAFDHAVKQIPARRWLGLTATPYRRDRLDDLIALQVGPVRHTISHTTDDRRVAADGQELPQLDLRPDSTGSRPTPVLHVHPTGFCYKGEADPSATGGIAAIYRDLVADYARTRQVANDVTEVLQRGRHCLVLTQWTAHVAQLADALQDRGYDPVILRGGMGAKARSAALARLQPRPDGPPLLAVATGPYIGEGFDCPALDTLFLAAPVAFKGRLVQYAGRILRPHPGKTTAEIHDYHDLRTGVLASSLAKRAPGYTSLGFPDPRRSS
jgi:hypothetical protein